jgi:hypothetical protein
MPTLLDYRILQGRTCGDILKSVLWQVISIVKNGIRPYKSCCLCQLASRI